MAYLRTEKASFEIDYPVEKIWAAVPEVVKALEWTFQERDDQNHNAKLKSKSGFMSYSSTLYIEMSSQDSKITKLTINAETPVTTITSVADFGRTRDRIELFVEVLAKEMEKRKSSQENKQPQL